MKAILGVLAFILLLGCISDPFAPTYSNTNLNTDITIPPEDTTPTKPVPEEPIVTDVNFHIVQQGNEIHIQSEGEKDLTYPFSDVCKDDVCLLSLQYASSVQDMTVTVYSEDFNILNKSIFELSKSNTFTIVATPQPVMHTCIFSYGKNDHTYISNYSATFKHVCLFMDELENETGLTLHPNYVLVWTSQDDTAGEYLGDDIIFLSQENPYKLSPTIMHEITHSLMEDAHFPNWINEGLAEYYSDKALDIFHPKTKYVEGVEDWTFGMDDTNLNVSNEFYESAHTTIQNFAEVYGTDKLRELTLYFIENPFVYTSSATKIQEHTQTILAKMREITGDEKLVSVEYLANLHKPKPAT